MGDKPWNPDIAQNDARTRTSPWQDSDKLAAFAFTARSLTACGRGVA